MAVPPFDIREWRDGRQKGDPRWVYGTPPKGNANFAWVQHMLYHLAPHGSMALLLANGSMSSNTKVEGKIRRALVEADLVECMLALPGQLFTNTQNPACVWFLTKNKKGRDASPSRPPVRNRTGEFLFIDARQLGYMRNRVLRNFTPANLEKIAGTFRAWKYDSKLTRSRGKRGEEKLSTSSLRVSAPPRETSSCSDIPGFCKSATLAEIAAHGHVLTPGRYVGTEETTHDGEPFDEKM